MTDADIGKWLVGLGGAGGVVFTLWRQQLQISRQKSSVELENTKDREERRSIERTREERDDAIKKAEKLQEMFVAEQRRADLAQVEIHQNANDIKELKAQVQRLTVVAANQAPEERDFLTTDTGFGGIDDFPQLDRKFDHE